MEYQYLQYSAAVTQQVVGGVPKQRLFFNMADAKVAGELGEVGPQLQKLAGVIGDNKKLIIQQHVSIFEAVCSFYEAANKYSIYEVDEEGKMGTRILLAEAKSPCCERQICAPYHSVILKVSDPGSGETYLSIQRKGWGSGKYCMPCCCACNEDLCNDGIIVHEGAIEWQSNICCMCCGQDVTEGNPISKINQASSCTPQLDVFAEVDSAEPYASITGPCCFGGASELCCKSKFEYKKGDTQIASMTKLAPSDCCACLKELCTDADKFSVEFEDGIEAEEKANSIAAVFLTDYMFFEQDQGICTVKDGGAKLTCFQCYCFGCLIPCTCKAQKGKKGEGGAPSKDISDAEKDKGALQTALPKAPEALSVERA